MSAQTNQASTKRENRLLKLPGVSLVVEKFRWSRFEFKVTKTHDGEVYSVYGNGKVLIDVPQALIRDANKEVGDWYEYLNAIIGAAALAFALGVQGTPNPPLNAFICLLFVQISHFAFNLNKFPKHLRSLREENRDAYRFLAKRIEGLQFSTWKIIKRAPLFLVGYLYLLLQVAMAFKSIQSITIWHHTLADIFLPKDCVCRFTP